ncbi:MAG TPA: AMP-binding protein, partial [Chroococcales cyanobacterium]
MSTDEKQRVKNSLSSNTVSALFFEAVERFPDSPCLASKENGKYLTVSYLDFAQKVEKLAAVLRERGIGKGDRVALMSDNRPEWPLWDQAVLSLCAVIVPIYPTLTPGQVYFILNDCQAKIFVLSGQSLLEPLIPILSNLSAIEEIIFFEAPEEIELPCQWTTTEILLESPISAGSKGKLAAIREGIGPEDLSSIIYTSGTTG